MQATAIGTVAVTIVLLGAFLFVRATLAGLGSDLLNQIEISAFLKADAGPGEVQAIRATLARDPHVLSVEYVPKQQGLRELRERTRGVIDLSILTENPLPDKIRVRVRDPEFVVAVATSLRTMAGVNNVVYGQELVQRLLRLGAVLRRVGIGVIALFVIVAGTIISNTIRLTVFARRREIAIMQLVGATNTHIRMPFICEGLLDGLLGALCAIVVLAIARVALWPRLLDAVPFIALNGAHVNAPLLIAELLVVGGCVGVIASWISVGRYLQT
jgi:cell division transport system permease protein